MVLAQDTFPMEGEIFCNKNWQLHCGQMKSPLDYRPLTNTETLQVDTNIPLNSI
jgi:hypothetical protein